MNIHTFTTLITTGANAVTIDPDMIARALRGGVVQVPYAIIIETTATARIRGSMDGTNYVNLSGDQTASAGGLVPLMPYMQLSCSAHTSGDVDASLLLP